MNVDRWRLAIGDGAARTSSCCGSPSPRILTVIALLFFSPHWRRQPKLAVPAHDPRLQHEAKALETRQEVDGPRRPAAPPTSKGQVVEMARGVFRLLFTMRVVGDRTRNYSPRLSAKADRGSAAGRRVTSRTAPSAYSHS